MRGCRMVARAGLGDNRVVVARCLTTDQVEMPPLAGEGTEAGLPHDAAQQQAVLSGVFGQLALGYELRFLSDVCLRSQMVHRRAHVQWLAVGVEYADVYSQSLVVQASAVGGVRHIVLLRRAFHGVPHFLLYGQRSGSVVDDEAVGGMFLAEQLLCL